MGVWKEMGWDGMNMELAEKIYKRKVGPERLACVLHSPRLILCVECRRIFSRRCSKRRRSRCARALPRSLLLLFLLPPLSKRACSQPRTGSVGHVVGEGTRAAQTRQARLIRTPFLSSPHFFPPFFPPTHNHPRVLPARPLCRPPAYVLAGASAGGRSDQQRRQAGSLLVQHAEECRAHSQLPRSSAPPPPLPSSPVRARTYAGTHSYSHTRKDVHTSTHTHTNTRTHTHACTHKQTHTHTHTHTHGDRIGADCAHGDLLSPKP